MGLHSDLAVVAPLIALLIVSPIAAHAEARVTHESTPDGEFWRIEQPEVRRRSTEYPQVQFKAGDKVLIDAGGCVQTGGSGRTWKRYVDPRGKNATKFYHGLIRIAG